MVVVVAVAVQAFIMDIHCGSGGTGGDGGRYGAWWKCHQMEVLTFLSPGCIIQFPNGGGGGGGQMLLNPGGSVEAVVLHFTCNGSGGASGNVFIGATNFTVGAYQYGTGIVSAGGGGGGAGSADNGTQQEPLLNGQGGNGRIPGGTHTRR